MILLYTVRAVPVYPRCTVRRSGIHGKWHPTAKADSPMSSHFDWYPVYDLQYYTLDVYHMIEAIYGNHSTDRTVMFSRLQLFLWKAIGATICYTTMYHA